MRHYEEGAITISKRGSGSTRYVKFIHICQFKVGDSTFGVLIHLNAVSDWRLGNIDAAIFPPHERRSSGSQLPHCDLTCSDTRFVSRKTVCCGKIDILRGRCGGGCCVAVRCARSIGSFVSYLHTSLCLFPPHHRLRGRSGYTFFFFTSSMPWSPSRAKDSNFPTISSSSCSPFVLYRVTF